MKYVSSSNNSNFNQNEADDKLLEILSSFMKFKNYFCDKEGAISGIESKDSEIKSLEDLISALPTKSVDELLSLANSYGISVPKPNTTSVYLVSEISEAIYSKIADLRKEAERYSDEYNKYQRTYIYTFEKYAKNIKNALDKPEPEKLQGEERRGNGALVFGIASDYKDLYKKFQSLISKLKVLNTWVVALAPEMDKLEDANDEIDRIKFRLSDEYKKVANVNSTYIPQYDVDTLEDDTGKLFSDLEKYRLQHDKQKEIILSMFDTIGVQINFKELKEQIFEDLNYIRTNISVAHEHNVVPIDEKEVDRFMDAFYTMFFYPIINECEFRTYLADHGVRIEDENLKSFEQLINANEEVKVQSQKFSENVNTASEQEPQKEASAFENSNTNDQSSMFQYYGETTPQMGQVSTVEIQPETPVSNAAELTDTNTSIDSASSVEVQTNTEWKPEIQVETPVVTENGEMVPPEASTEVQEEQSISTGQQTVFGVVSTTPTSDADLANARNKAKGIIDAKEAGGARDRGGDIK